MIRGMQHRFKAMINLSNIDSNSTTLNIWLTVQLRVKLSQLCNCNSKAISLNPKKVSFQSKVTLTIKILMQQPIEQNRVYLVTKA